MSGMVAVMRVTLRIWQSCTNNQKNALSPMPAPSRTPQPQHARPSRLLRPRGAPLKGAPSVRTPLEVLGATGERLDTGEMLGVLILPEASLEVVPVERPNLNVETNNCSGRWQ